MKRLLLVAVLAVALLAASGASAPAKVRTTAPGYNFYIGVYIKDTRTETRVSLTRSVGRRGWRAHFIVHNQGKARHRFEVGGLKTRWIQPGRKTRLGAQLDVRGQYAYKVDDKLRGYFTVI
jgi:opacity protein-like surface antigen